MFRRNCARKEIQVTAPGPPSGLWEVDPWLITLGWSLGFRLHLLPSLHALPGLLHRPTDCTKAALLGHHPSFSAPAHSVTMCHQQVATASYLVSLPLCLAPQSILPPAIRLISKYNSKHTHTHTHTHTLTQLTPSKGSPDLSCRVRPLQLSLSAPTAPWPACHANSVLPAPSGQPVGWEGGTKASASPLAPQSPLPCSTTCQPSHHSSYKARLRPYLLLAGPSTSPVWILCDIIAAKTKCTIELWIWLHLFHLLFPEFKGRKYVLLNFVLYHQFLENHIY